MTALPDSFPRTVPAGAIWQEQWDRLRTAEASFDDLLSRPSTSDKANTELEKQRIYIRILGYLMMHLPREDAGWTSSQSVYADAMTTTFWRRSGNSS